MGDRGAQPRSPLNNINSAVITKFSGDGDAAVERMNQSWKTEKKKTALIIGSDAPAYFDAHAPLFAAAAAPWGCY